MKNFTVPTREEVSENNQAIFDQVQKGIGMVPNLLAYMAKNETALGDVLALQNRKSTLRSKEREMIKLVASQINGCRYCQSAHSVVGKMLGFTDEQIIEIRQGSASFDTKLDALAKFAASLVTNRGNASQETKDAFFAAGYNEANMIDVVMVIGDMAITNSMHRLTGFEIDFPLAPELTHEAVWSLQQNQYQEFARRLSIEKVMNELAVKLDKNGMKLIEDLERKMG